MIQSFLPIKKYALTEREILRQVRSYLKFRGWFVIRLHQGLEAHKGLSDLVAIKDGKALWIEIKTQKGRLSPWQEQFKYNIESAGGTYIIVRLVEQLEEVLF